MSSFKVWCLPIVYLWLLLTQGKYDELEAKFRAERAVLEAKYEMLYQPFYTKVIVTEQKSLLT